MDWGSTNSAFFKLLFEFDTVVRNEENLVTLRQLGERSVVMWGDFVGGNMWRAIASSKNIVFVYCMALIWF